MKMKNMDKRTLYMNAKNKTKLNMRAKIGITVLGVLMLVLLIFIGMALWNSGFLTQRRILADNITNTVAKYDVAPIVLDDPEEQDGNKTSEVMSFAVEILQNIQATDGNTNVLISPYSIVTALAMAENGADGNTLSQMEETLGTDLESLKQFLYAYAQYMPSSQDCSLHVANSIWIKDLDVLNIKEEFLKDNRTYFDGQIFQAPFDQTTLSDINNWVYNETDGMVEDILNQIPEDAIMYLVNALSFDAEWSETYEKSQVRDLNFTSSNGDVSEVEFLVGNEYQYIEIDGGIGFAKPYADNQYSFVAILPDENVEDLLSNLDSEELLNAISNTSPKTVNTYIPKFSYEYDIELSEILTTMGMVDAFNEDAADFTNMLELVDTNIFIDRVLHKTFITVDENGTEAGAATVIEFLTESASANPNDTVEVRLDRPFLFMIVDNEFHLPIFMGVVDNIN